MSNENTDDERDSTGLPPSVIERLTKYAERTKRELDDVMTEFFTYISKEHLCNNWREEDDDLLEDWAEQMLIETRNVSSGGGGMSGLTPFVGCFVGVDAKQTDRRAWEVRRAKRDYTMDPNAAIASGFVGHYTKGAGVWNLTNKDGEKPTDYSLEDGPPDNAFTADGDVICLLARSGRPKAMSMNGRNYYFLGAKEEDFTKDNSIQLWRVDMQGEDANAVVRIGTPCRILARPPNENAKEEWKDSISTPMGTRDTILYTDEFVDESMRHLLHPFKYWLDHDLHGLGVSLEELVEAYQANSRTFVGSDGSQGKSGPIVFVKGTVNRLSSEPRENQYDEDGRGYSIALTSTALQSLHGAGEMSEVMCWIGSACNDLTNPFVAFNEDDVIPYAERSTVLVCGRIAIKVNNGVETPNLKVMGVFADSRRIRRRQEGGDTGRGQFE